MGRGWMKPELIEVVRRKPEESVLAACKTAATGGGGYTPSDTGCRYALGCPPCDGIGAS